MSDVTASARARAVYARHAASLLVWREGAGGLEVLMGVRGAKHRFMPNRLVFPGGAVDPADRRAAAASEPDAETLAMIGRVTRPPLARAVVMAAARELREETSLSFGDPPRLDAIRYLCRAVTPPASPIRFNARFLVAPASAVSGEATDSAELGSVRFYAVQEALGLGLMGVTAEVLGQLREWVAMDEAARAGRALMAYRSRRWVRERALSIR